jgi:xylulokinase
MFEQDAAEWEATLLRCIRGLGAKAELAEVVAVTGQGSTSVCLDSAGRVIGPVISHLDRRFFAERSDAARLPSMGYVATKMAAPLSWLRANRPRDFRRVRKVLDVREYVGFLLSGVVTHDASAFSAGIDRRFLDSVGLADGVLGEPHDNITPIGTVAQRFLARSGLGKGTKVLLAPFDGLCSIVGVGVDRKGLLADVPGSTEVLATPVDPVSAMEVLPRALDGLSLF